METKNTTQVFDCPLCKTDNYEKIKLFSDGVVVGKCESCDLIYTPLRHNAPEDLFGGISMEYLQMMYRPILEKKKKHFRDKIFRKYLHKIKKYTPGNKHLDVGCAHGFFMDISRGDGFEVTGVEPNATMAEFGKTYLDLNIHNGTLDQVTLNDKWDIITFTDSLEYFKDPITDLSNLVNNNLNEKGIIFIKVPNGDYFVGRHFFKKVGLSLGRAEPFSPSKRVVHYTHSTIQQLIRDSAMDVVKTGHFLPIDSPVWYKYIGVHLEVANPWWLGWKERIVRKVLHFLGVFEFFILRKNHFSQAVYVIARKK